MTTNVAVLGSSGSIGTQTLDIIRSDPNRYRVSALGVGSSLDVIAQAQEFRPDVVAVADEHAAGQIRGALGPETRR